MLQAAGPKEILAIGCDSDRNAIERYKKRRRRIEVVERRLLRGALVRRSQKIVGIRSEEHTSELQSHLNLVCRLLLEKKKGRPDSPTYRAPRSYALPARPPSAPPGAYRIRPWLPRQREPSARRRSNDGWQNPSPSNG